MSVTANMMLGETWLQPQTMLLIGVVLIIASLMWHNARRRTRSRADGRASRYTDRHNARLGAQAREDIDELMVRLEELSREICGQIDTRFAKLEHLLKEADEKLAALTPPATDGSIQADEGSPPVPADPQHAEVHELGRQGLAVVDIARRTGKSAGEVELILSLERSRRGGAGREEQTGPKRKSTARKGAGLDERA